MSAMEPRFKDPAEQQRLWEWTLHEDLLFSERQNLFLIAESMLVAGHAAALEASAESAAVLIGGIALALTLAWLYVSRRMAVLVNSIQKHARRELREYGEIYLDRPEALMGSQVVVAYFVPMLLAMLWILLLVRLA